jgi:RNA polymerase sigma-70 factor, ECF subfamily
VSRHATAFTESFHLIGRWEAEEVAMMNTDESMVPPEPASLASKPPDAEAWVDATYAEMRNLASRFLSGESQTVSLSPTVLVHEVYVRMTKQRGVSYQSKSHFLAVASTMMRRILVDHARARTRVKRGGKRIRVSFDESMFISTSRDEDVLAMEEALQELAALDARQSRIVEMRFFGGMTVPEVAEALQLSTRTIEKEWQLSKAWLRKRLDNNNPR